ncbi:MAG TPA: GAF domain-containing protein, partial [Methylomirabilota bacterium]|nr:GAF domain-containing protein [Methylomirabilota bacterium]
LAQAFADQAALAIENARLYSESARRQRTAETLAELGRLITRSLDPQEVQDQIVDSVRALFRFHNAVLFQLEPATEDLTAIAMAGDFFQLVQGLAPSAEQSDSSITNSASRKFYTLPKGIGIAGLAVRERSVVTTENILADPRIELTPQMQRAFQQASICSSLSAPLIVKDRVIGALSFGDRESRAFTTEEIQLAQAFADQAALALENARLFEEATQQRHEAEELANVARTLTGSLDLSAVGARIAEAVHRLFGVAAVAVWQKREDGSLLLLGVGGSSPDTYPPGYCMPWGQGVAGRVVIENRPIYSEDALNDPNIDLPEGYHRFADSGIHAIQAMPLHAKGELVGVLAMADKHGRIFSAAEKTLLQTCADQAALAIENARLYTDAMRRQREAESLAEVGRHISLLQEPQKVQQQIVESVRSLLHTKVAALFRLDSESGNLFVMATSGDHGSLDLTQPLPARAGVSGLAVVERRPVASSDILSDPKLIFPPEVRANYERSPIRASLSVPLIVKEQVIGALTQSDTAGRVYTPEEIQLAQAFADQAALAMENARLFSDATRRQREAEELAEVARTLTESLDPHAVAERIAEGVQRLLDVGSAGVFERLPHNSLRALAVSGVAGELYPPDYLIPVGSGVAGQAVEKGEMVFSADVINDPGIIPTEVHERFAAVGSGAMLATPLHSKGKIIGALIVSDRVGRVFTDAEISLFRTLADHAAVAMENARLY